MVKSFMNLIECTLYIENLRGEYDHQSLKDFFSKYGNVSLVSLPRNKETREFKGFGFIEFDNRKQMEKALKSKSAKKNEWKIMSKFEWEEVYSALLIEQK